jgi:hypothetical protein
MRSVFGEFVVGCKKREESRRRELLWITSRIHGAEAVCVFLGSLCLVAIRLVVGP